MLGGYKIIDLTGHTFVLKTAQTVEGIHEAIEESYKPLLLTGLKVGTAEFRPMFVEATGGSPYVIKTSAYTISIATDDKVTVTANA